MPRGLYWEMKSESLIRGIELLAELDDLPKISFDELKHKVDIDQDELRKLLKYLKEKDFIKWRLGLFVNDSPISPGEISLTHKGMEVSLGKRDYFDETKIPHHTIHNQTNIDNSSGVQVAQSTGENSPITQEQEVKIDVLKKELEEELKKSKPDKSKLKNILEKIIGIAKSGSSMIIAEIILKVIGVK